MRDEQGEVDASARQCLDGRCVVIKGRIGAAADGQLAVVHEVWVDLSHYPRGEACEEGNVAADARAPRGNGDEVRGSDRDDDDVRSEAVSPREDLTHKILALGGGRDLRSHRTRGLEPRLPATRHDSRPGVNRERAVDQADRAGSQNKNT